MCSIYTHTSNSVCDKANLARNINNSSRIQRSQRLPLSSATLTVLQDALNDAQKTILIVSVSGSGDDTTFQGGKSSGVRIVILNHFYFILLTSFVYTVCRRWQE